MWKKSNTVVAISLCVLCQLSHAEDEEADLFLQEIMALSKMTGTCGILNSMIGFQKSTQLDGGSEFIARFWSTESARLGMSVEGYVTRCNDSIESYDKLWASLESGE